MDRRLLLNGHGAEDHHPVRTVALTEVVGTFDGESLDNARAAMVLRIEGGRFTEIWSHHYDQEEMDQLWS